MVRRSRNQELPIELDDFSTSQVPTENTPIVRQNTIRNPNFQYPTFAILSSSSEDEIWNNNAQIKTKLIKYVS